MMPQRLIATLKTLLASKHVFWWIPALAAINLAFGLDVGWIIDDHVQRAALTRHSDFPEWHRSAGSLFTFTDGDRDDLRESVARGTWPWWSAPDLHLAFWRPISGWSHALDYRAWPENPWLMHLHSLAWFLLALVVLLALYRHVLPHPAVAGLAGLIYAVDDSQAIPVLWLANRNAVLAVAFGAAALAAHDRWRRAGWKAGAIAGPLLLLAAVLANEGAVAVGGYLLAYAICLDPAPWRERLAALLPSAGVGLAWAVAYKIGDYGAVGSGIYIDPAAEPLRAATLAVERAPLLLWGWWGFPPADLASILPDATRWWRWLVIMTLLALLTLLLRGLLRREAVARFLGLGMLLALLPATTTFPSNRLLGFVGIGASGLLALALADLASTATTGRRWPRRALIAVFVLIHLVVAPLLARSNMAQMLQLERTVRRAAESLAELADRPQESEAEVIIVATPAGFVSFTSGITAALVYGWRPWPIQVLSSSIYDTEITRTDASTLVIRPRGGFLRRPGMPHPAGIESEVSGPDPRRFFPLLDHLFRNVERDGFQVGDRVELDGKSIEIVEASEGRPLAVAVDFSEPLESSRWLFLVWRQGRYERFRMPEVGGTAAWPGLY